MSDQTENPRPAGADLARAALEAARRSTRNNERTNRAGWRRVAGQARPSWTGSGADPRDPQTVGALIDGLLGERGWTR
ncbi:MAG: hypothetical protein M3513_10125, partial [Actinomycetota bacterium]|nr:hypothetical protein [Actinomycetota bacterium]